MLLLGPSTSGGGRFALAALNCFFGVETTQPRTVEGTVARRRGVAEVSILTLQWTHDSHQQHPEQSIFSGYLFHTHTSGNAKVLDYGLKSSEYECTQAEFIFRYNRGRVVLWVGCLSIATFVSEYISMHLFRMSSSI